MLEFFERIYELLFHIFVLSIVLSVILLIVPLTILFFQKDYYKSKLSFWFSVGIFCVFIAFGVIGLMIGFLAGISRDPAIPTLLTALLPALGVGYVLFRDKELDVLMMVTLVSLIFASNVFVGSMEGATARSMSEGLDARISRALEDAQIAQLRSNLGLAPTSP